jgi:hypothetical protein
MNMPITIENYEAFYLDYLEGNLSGETLVAFEAFLAAHPELSVEEDALVTLQPCEESFDAVQKLSMKQGIDMGDLNEETIEFFLIAREEGLLSVEQTAHLNHWLEANAHYQQDARLYALTTFEVDAAVVYEGKADLKKPIGGRVIPMWFTGLAVAAGLALLFTIGMNQGETTQGKPTKTEAIAKAEQHSGEQTNQTATNNGDKTIKIKTPKGKNTQVDHQQPSIGGKKVNEQKPNSPKRPVYQHSILHEGTVLASLEKRRAQFSPGSDKTITPMVIPQPTKIVPETLPTEDLALVTVDEMKNPIKPVTSRLSETLNTPLDFRTAKAAKKKGGGFYFKIGKVEVSHQTASL